MAWHTSARTTLRVEAGVSVPEAQSCTMAGACFRSTRRVGMASACALLIALIVYGITLALGFASRSSPTDPIGDPYFSILEIAILIIAPAIVILMSAVHQSTPHTHQVYSLAALAFATMLAMVTCSVHFVIFALSTHLDQAALSDLTVFLSFTWPSLAYALDILAWDVFFALAMLSVAPAFMGRGINRAIRISAIVSGALAMAGLAGAATGDMSLRNIGIAGYLGVFLIVVLLLFVRFWRAGEIGEERGA